MINAKLWRELDEATLAKLEQVIVEEVAKEPAGEVIARAVRRVFTEGRRLKWEEVERWEW